MKPTIHKTKNIPGEQILRKAIDLLGVAAILPLKDVKRRIHDDVYQGGVSFDDVIRGELEFLHRHAKTLNRI